MKTSVLGFWAVVFAAALALTACGSSKSTNVTPTNSGGGATTVATSPSTAGQPSATTACTIPQNNGGDHDADNNGAPSDGDGCDK